ncbi:MAG: hypothetical protein ACFCU4_08260 [Puniceicoccaceae bacterium]
MRTTLDIPDEIFRQIKAEAALSGAKLKDLLAELIKKGLAARAAQPLGPRPRSPLPVPLPRVTGAPAIRALTNAEIHRLLDQQDLEHHLPPHSHAQRNDD